jgi:hypothetical protein
LKICASLASSSSSSSSLGEHLGLVTVQLNGDLHGSRFRIISAIARAAGARVERPPDRRFHPYSCGLVRRFPRKSWLGVRRTDPAPMQVRRDVGTTPDSNGMCRPLRKL